MRKLNNQRFWSRNYYVATEYFRTFKNYLYDLDDVANRLQCRKKFRLQTMLFSKTGKNYAFQIRQNQLLYQQKRFRGKINVVKPRKPHYWRGIITEFLTPYYANPKKDIPVEELCAQSELKYKKEVVLGPYDLIIAREIRNWFDNSKMIAVCHKNSMMSDDVFDFAVPLRKANMYLKTYETPTILKALEDTPYLALKPMLTNFYTLIFSPEINVTRLEKIVKKCPQVHIMAGVLEGRVLNYNDFMKYGKMDITMARSGLVHVLQTAGGNNLTQQLNHHQSTLVTRLKQIGTNETTPNENEQSVPA